MTKKKAWYLDEDVLLEGQTKKNKFYPDTKLCGFYAQEFDDEMIGKVLFFDLQEALAVCGHVPVITAQNG